MNRGLDRGALLTSLIADAAGDASTVRAPLDRSGAAARPRPENGVSRLPLPPPAAARESLQQSLHRRTAVRGYQQRPVQAAQLAAMLHGAQRQDTLNWAGEQAAGVELELLCAAWRVSSVDTALYRYDPGTDPAGNAAALVRLAPLPTGAAAEDLVLQREFAWAPALVLVLGDLAAAVRRHGSHGHRLLLHRAGAAAHAAWLAALGTGLDGTVFAGLLPGAVRELLGADGYSRAPLFAFSVGWALHPAEEHVVPASEGGES